MTTPPVLIDRAGTVWTLTLNRAHKRNALDLPERHALIDALHAADADADCAACVLTGAGPIFSAGGDISAMPTDPDAARARLHVLTELACALIKGSKPVIAAVEGGAFGLGLSLAAACDYIVASRDARLAASFGKLGLVADTGLFWSLSQRVGPGRAKELLLFATELSATEALAIGLVSELVEPGATLARARERAQVFADASAAALAATKQIFAQPDQDIDAILAAETAAQVRLLSTEEFSRRQRAFLQRSKAQIMTTPEDPGSKR
jgi:2-(1,2-epoxy-1,2-dihydrophenyl)acetyl-CoA isomerase